MRKLIRRAGCAVALCVAAGAIPFASAAPASVYLEDLTWTEVRDAIATGKTTIIIPVGGVEQSGPHMALGKHDVRAHALAGMIAARLGDALVAPVVAYVPEGAISPPTAHMKFPGTISVPDDAFRGVLEGAARSLRQHGFTRIVLIGDHGGYQGQLKLVAARLNRDWTGTPARVLFIADYYRVTENEYPQALRARGLTQQQIGTHAGAADTSLMLAVDPSLVREDAMTRAPQDVAHSGVAGDPRPATAALGQLGVTLMVDHAVAAIRAQSQAGLP